MGQSVLELGPMWQESPQFCERANDMRGCFPSLCGVTSTGALAASTGHVPIQTEGQGRRLHLLREGAASCVVIFATCHSGIPHLTLSGPALPLSLRPKHNWFVSFQWDAPSTRYQCLFTWTPSVSLSLFPPLQSAPPLSFILHPDARWSYSNIKILIHNWIYLGDL